jgi:transposase
MECELWPPLYALVLSIGKTLRRRGVRYSDAVVILVFFWACLHDRPQCWACQPRNWKSTHLKPVLLPSDSTVSRRLRSPSAMNFLRALEERVRGSGDQGLVKFIDGKPLIVGCCSKDPDAKVGRVVGGFTKGYKLYAIWGQRPLPEAWTVRPLNENEARVAVELIPRLSGSGYLEGDAEYDANRLYDLANAYHHQLVTPRNPRKGKAPDLVAANLHRRHAAEMLHRPFGKTLFKERNQIERKFGSAVCFGGGLAPLPAWVRRLHRVHRWVTAKLILNGLRIQKRLTA